MLFDGIEASAHGWQPKAVPMKPSQTRREVSCWENIGHARLMISTYPVCRRDALLELNTQTWRDSTSRTQCTMARM
jgi:hypothetical protein